MLPTTVIASRHPASAQDCLHNKGIIRQIMGYLTFGLENGFSALIDAEKTDEAKRHAGLEVASINPHLTVTELQDISLALLSGLIKNQEYATFHVSANNLNIILERLENFTGKGSIGINICNGADDSDAFALIENASFTAVLNTLLYDIISNSSLYTQEHMYCALNYIYSLNNADKKTELIKKTNLFILNHPDQFTDAFINPNYKLGIARHIFNNMRDYTPRIIDKLIDIILHNIDGFSELPLHDTAQKIVNRPRGHDSATIRCALHFIATHETPYENYPQNIIDSIVNYTLLDPNDGIDENIVTKTISHILRKPNLFSYTHLKDKHITAIVEHVFGNIDQYPKEAIHKLLDFVIRGSIGCFKLSIEDAAQEILIHPKQGHSITAHFCATHFIATDPHLFTYPPEIIIKVIGYILPDAKGEVSNGIKGKLIKNTILQILAGYEQFADKITEGQRMSIFHNICQFNDSYPAETTDSMLRLFVSGKKKIGRVILNIIINQHKNFPSANICAAILIMWNIESFKHQPVMLALDCILSQFNNHFPDVLSNRLTRSYGQPFSTDNQFIHSVFRTAVDQVFTQPEFSGLRQKYKGILFNYIFKHMTSPEAVFGLATFIISNASNCAGLTIKNATETIIRNAKEYSGSELCCAILFVEANPTLFSAHIQKNALRHIADNLNFYPPNTGIQTALNFIEENYSFFSAPQIDQEKFSSFYRSRNKLDVLASYSNALSDSLTEQTNEIGRRKRGLTLWHKGKYEKALLTHPPLVSFILKTMDHEVISLWNTRNKAL